MIVIIDYGVGNLGSIQNMLRKIGVDSVISSRIEDLPSASRLILPGVGAFDTCSQKLNQSGMLPALNEKVLSRGTPLLGICVGMQLLLDSSDEGVLPGLGWIEGQNIKFKQEHLGDGLKIPHMGWTDVSVHKQSKLLKDMPDEPRFYFVHSYHAELAHPDDATLMAKHGYPFVAGIERKNILGVQFHPEKSHTFGMKLLENFVKYY